MYRKLSAVEREQLAARGVHASDWESIEVAEDFLPDQLRRCSFSGRVRIGSGAHIADVALIESRGSSRHGMMTPVATINEAGGREVPLHRSLTAQTAYIMALYRHRPEAIARLQALAEAESPLVDFCLIGQGASIIGCGVLRDVHIGAQARLEGVQLLENTTAEGFVGHGTRATDCYLAAGSRVDSGASLRRCLVGNGAQVEEGFTAIDSLVFRGSRLGAGEACSIFAGPYTVSHHKSSLLIAGLFSFFNAGSGANQSNHLFKTGAVHQGIHERGAKLSSNAYIMLPARTGAFNIVLGRHTAHADSSDFPYSYIVEQEGRSWLLPGAALKSCGAARDIKKWPARDAGLAAGNDLLNFQEHNPYIASKFVRAIRIAEELLASPAETYTYNRLKISALQLQRGADIYRQALQASLAAMLEKGESRKEKGIGDWVDLAGMYAPKVLIDQLLEQIEAGKFADMAAIHQRLAHIHDNYAAHANAWALDQLAGASVEEAVERGRKAASQIADAAAKDALKDSSALMTTGYGIDDAQAIVADFNAVRK